MWRPVSPTKARKRASGAILSLRAHRRAAPAGRQAGAKAGGTGARSYRASPRPRHRGRRPYWGSARGKRCALRAGVGPLRARRRLLVGRAHAEKKSFPDAAAVKGWSRGWARAASPRPHPAGAEGAAGQAVTLVVADHGCRECREIGRTTAKVVLTPDLRAGTWARAVQVPDAAAAGP
eukprot:scaffold12705_cov106-Isochrysis_galbana.AAC.6